MKAKLPTKKIVGAYDYGLPKPDPHPELADVRTDVYTLINSLRQYFRDQAQRPCT